MFKTFTPADKYAYLAQSSAPQWQEVAQFCKDKEVNLLWLRRSTRSFTGWVAVAGYDACDSFPGAAFNAVNQLSREAADIFFAEHAYLAVRENRFAVTVSIPCIPRNLYAIRLRARRITLKKLAA
ncbi:hypothetical protein NIES4071_108360 (plasmid) [Calothrix sp. NIES-4071]|nr:hypothetical protein NIES4071_108360 [Calothrix sp. NIES-4071]BAZ64876.1 hypothetical protein NIES4105_106090 [Calothrix sp. NIES-4105]